MARAKASNLSITELQDLLDKKIAQERRKLPSLISKRNKLAAQLEEIDNQIALVEGSAPSKKATGKRGRAKKVAAKRGRKPAAKKAAKKRGRKPAAKKAAKKATRKVGGKLSIPAAIHKVLEDAGEPMTTEAIREAIKSGKLIKRISKSFQQQVGIALSRHKEFKRKGRGLYSL